MSTASQGNGQVPKRKRASMFDIQPGQYKPKRLRTGAIFTVIVVIFLYVIYTKPSVPLLSGGGQTFKADFQYAANVRPGYTPVRVYGVNVGQVTGVARGPSGRGVELKMQFDSGMGVKLHSDASVNLRWRTLLGRNMYVDVNPGSPSAPALSGTIPESRTTSQVELDQAIEPLNATGRQALQTIIDQFNAGFADPKAVGRTLDNFGPSMQNLAKGLPGLRGEQVGDLPALVRSTSKMMGALAANEVSLGGLIDNGATALGVTAARQADIGSMFDIAPGALQNTQATMVRLRTTLDTLDPIARALIPGAAKLDRAATLAKTALDLANPLLTDAKPTLAALRPSVNALSRASTAGVPVVQSLTNTMQRVKGQFIPFLNATDPETKLKNYEAVGPAVAGVDSAVSLGDQWATVANFEAGFGENTVTTSPCQTFFTDPSVPLNKKIDCEALAQLLTSILSGQKVTTPLAHSTVAQSLVSHLLLGKRVPKVTKP
jgi:virulence factor Mce-like protein